MHPFIIIFLSILLAVVITFAFNFIFTVHKSDVNTGLFVVQVITFTIVILMTTFWPEHPTIPDYQINLEQDSIHIETKEGNCFMFHADSIDIDEFIIQDNL